MGYYFSATDKPFNSSIHLFICLSMYLLNKYLVITHCMAGSALGARIQQ